MKNRWLILKGCFITGLLAVALQAQYRTAGSVAYQHLLLDYDARSVGMAGASVAVPGKGIGIFSNPGSAASVRGMEGFVGYQLVLDGVWGAPIGVVREFPGIGVFSVGIQGLTSGSTESRMKQRTSALPTMAVSSLSST